MANRKPDLPQDSAWGTQSEWTPPTEATFLNGRRDAAYWLLVDQLMHLGWYRLGQRAGNAREWGFRRGYTLPDYGSDAVPGSPQERWISAFHEQTAMRRLLREVEDDPRGQRVLESDRSLAGSRQPGR